MIPVCVHAVPPCLLDHVHNLTGFVLIAVMLADLQAV